MVPQVPKLKMTADTGFPSPKKVNPSNQTLAQLLEQQRLRNQTEWRDPTGQF